MALDLNRHLNKLMDLQDQGSINKRKADLPNLELIQPTDPWTTSWKEWDSDLDALDECLQACLDAAHPGDEEYRGDPGDERKNLACRPTAAPEIQIRPEAPLGR